MGRMVGLFQKQIIVLIGCMIKMVGRVKFCGRPIYMRADARYVLGFQQAYVRPEDFLASNQFQLESSKHGVS